MGWPQWVVAALLVVSIVAAFPRSVGKDEAVSKIAGAAIMALLLHAGGFWR